MGGKTGRLTAAGHRSNRHTVNLSDEEEELWQAAFAATRHKEFAVWTRAAVNDAIGRPGLGEVPMVPEVNHGAYLLLARLGNNLNQLTRAVNGGELPRDLLPELERVIAEVGDAALAVRGLRPVASGEWEADTDSSRDETEWIDPEDGPA
ncbi:plasmid mobilization relaxosome protein MobC [Kitasatospora sp. NBC_00315]|uniref:plasmid mobilization relaxosome protein MobC n=1 Tax=Kitasatospora sp. NBC_00315 TaxID=2975963 RepID=UPI002F917C10